MNGIAVGLQKGHVVSKRTVSARPAQRKGVSFRALCNKHVMISLYPAMNLSATFCAASRQARQNGARTHPRCRGKCPIRKAAYGAFKSRQRQTGSEAGEEKGDSYFTIYVLGFLLDTTVGKDFC